MQGILLGSRSKTTETIISDGDEQLLKNTVFKVKKFVVTKEMFYSVDGVVDNKVVEQIRVKSGMEILGVFQFRPNALLKPSLRDFAIMQSFAPDSILAIFTSTIKDCTLCNNYCMFTLDEQQEYFVKIKARITNICPSIPVFDCDDGIEMKEAKVFYEHVVKSVGKQVEKLDVY